MNRQRTGSLYHFSDNGSIECFVPRPPLAHPEQEPLVWAIDEQHQPMYFVPRDCPRVCFWPLPTSTPEDLDRFWAYVPDRMVIAIEAAWYERLCTTRIYRYHEPDASFQPLQNDAWMYVSRETVVPIDIEPIDNLPQHLLDAGVELRVCSSLVPLGKVIVAATLHFSLIRMRNAKGWT